MKENETKVYISGKITGTYDYMERFDEAEKYLKCLGYDVINPALVNSRLPESTTYEQYMRMAFCMLDMADTVYMLSGWQNSNGARAEYCYAQAVGKQILYER